MIHTNYTNLIAEKEYTPFSSPAKKSFKQFLFFKRNIPLYHGTTQDILPSVRTNGIIGPKSGSDIKTSAFHSKQSVVYLTTSLKESLEYAYLKSRHFWATPRNLIKKDIEPLDICVFKINSNSLDIDNIGFDDNIVKGNKNNDYLSDIYFEYHDNIMPKQINSVLLEKSETFESLLIKSMSISMTDFDFLTRIEKDEIFRFAAKHYKNHFKKFK